MMKLQRYFTTEDKDVFADINWVRKDAIIKNEKGDVIFEQRAIEAPDFWSNQAVNIVASKYFRGQMHSPEREDSVKQLIGRVAGSIANWGLVGKYFSLDDSVIFQAELEYILITQMASFNSPVWFNVGFEDKPQTSACFINSVEDSMESILDLAKTEGMLFKFGSGSGVNMSTLRSSKEKLSSGGEPSGPVSFMRGLDAFAGVIKSGGRTRRAAKMVILNADHPDILEFIKCKELEEKKAWALIEAGYDGSFNGEAYKSIMFQNANNSIRVSDKFMKAVKDGGTYKTKLVTTGEACEELKAKDVMMAAAESAHLCGDPGMQFDDVINEWHTCPQSGRINSSNPCSEYMFLDDTACNLASLNLMKFKSQLQSNTFLTSCFSSAVRTMILAQEILVSFSSYPTPKIAQNSQAFRPLGLGYANLGALLMASGYPYDSEDGRHYAAAVTSLMCAEAYLMSAEIAKHMGAFAGFAANKFDMLKVVEKHAGYTNYINKAPEIVTRAVTAWNAAIKLGRNYGFRNSQVTVLAPTGTIGFMMDCDTTGVEPDIALVKYKKLAGSGDAIIKIVNGSVDHALRNLGYTGYDRHDILDHIEKTGTIENCKSLDPQYLPIFDCALKPTNGTRSISWEGHLKMCAAVQPFLSGAISKTINMPAESTVEDIYNAYILGWELGLKAVALYRDGSKRSQPLSTSLKNNEKATAKPTRKHLPDERASITHKFTIGGHEGYLTVGLYTDGSPGELFIVMSKEGSIVSGLVNTVAEGTSIALQHGVPLDAMVRKYKHTRFEPSGFTSNKDISYASSIIDYIFRWLEIKFGAKKTAMYEAIDQENRLTNLMSTVTVKQASMDAPPCGDCGSLTTRNGSCFKCANCGGTSGCS